MEISQDIIVNISGILIDAKAKHGDLSQIEYVGGSRGKGEIISYIIESINSFLISKNYLDRNDEPIVDFEKDFNDLSLFLMINTKYSKPFDIEEYSYLTYNIPKISKCILMTIILKLRLTKYFCTVIQKFPIKYSHELYHACIPVIDRIKLQNVIKDSIFLLESIVEIMVLNPDQMLSDEMDSILRTPPEFFKRLTCLSMTDLEGITNKILYSTIGHALSGLLNLFIRCHEKNIQETFIKQLIVAIIWVLKGVSVHTFLYWGEIDINGENLQSIISETAYNITNKYQHFEPASELISMLKPMASKPKDLKEQIRMADVNKIITMINKADANQKQWFEALIFSPFFSNENAVQCVEKWHYLCNDEDVSRIINSSVCENQNAKLLALKCASNLNTQDLKIVITRHFHKNGFLVLNEDTQSRLIELFNKLSNEIDANFISQLLLSILENPECAIKLFLTECLKNSCNFTTLRSCFIDLEPILNVHGFGINCTMKIMNESFPTVDNFKIYAQLFEEFIKIELLTTDSLILKIIDPIMNSRLEDNKLEELQVIVKILNILNVQFEVNENMEQFFINLFKILSLRTDFMTYKTDVMDLIQEVINFITNKVRRFPANDLSFLTENSKNEFITFYINYLHGSDCTLFETLMKNWTSGNNARNVGLLVQILPCCVHQEWVEICKEIKERSNSQILLKNINDFLKILCDLALSQNKADNYASILSGLKYCIQQTGIMLQKIFINADCTLETEILLTESLVEMLINMPQDIKQTEGINITNLMTTRSLKTFENNINFVNKLCMIKDSKICEILANKIIK